MKRLTNGSAVRIAYASIALAFIGSFSTSARAECLGQGMPEPEDFNVCRHLVEALWIPPVITTSSECRVDFPECLAELLWNPVPFCCAPGACELDPACKVLRKVEEEAGYWLHPGSQPYCDFQEISADTILDDLQKGLIENLSPLTNGGLGSGLFRFAGAQVDWLACQADELPPDLKKVIRELISQIPAQPLRNDAIDRVGILEESHPTAGAYLVSPYSAITLDTLVIMRDWMHTVAKNFNRTWLDALNRRLTVNEERAVFQMIHELMHVTQYLNEGREQFINTYLTQALIKSYATEPHEQDAYEFEGRARWEMERRRRAWQATLANL